MTATAHALVGGAIAASFSNPAIGLPLAAASHPLLDLIPHWDFGWGWREKSKKRLFLEACFDLGLGVALAYLLFGKSTNLWYLFSAIFLSEVWDLMEVPYWLLKWKFPPFSSFYNVQSKLQGKAKDMSTGILTQVGTVAGIMLVLKFIH